MLKKERLVRITQMVNQKGIISINEIMEQLEISDMTARRDLDELEKSGKLLRVHGLHRVYLLVWIMNVLI